MKRYWMLLLVLSVLGVWGQQRAWAQFAGSAVGSDSSRSQGSESPAGWSLGPELSSDAALNFITVDGTAELRVAADEIRVVLAVTSEAETADGCQELAANQVSSVLALWKELEVPDQKVVEDFISVLPVYEWRIVERDGKEVRIQQREGYRMQTNLHIAVANEEQAMEAVNRAFQAGVTDIVAFDYWSAHLDEHQAKARQAAIDAAKAKAEVLLGVFEDRPRVINVQEKTAVFFPRSLYHTFENVLSESVDWGSSWRDKPRILAYRPKKTFFQGLQKQADVRPKELPMRAEIAVISTVRLYYQSPAEPSRTVDH